MTDSIDAMATIGRNDLAGALTFASLGLSKRPAVPVLAGVLVTVGASGLELAAFDYEVTARIAVPCDTAGETVFLANGGELAAAVKALPKGKNVTADLTVAGDRLLISCEGTEASISSLPIDEYPQLPVMPEVTGLIDGAAFVRSALRVVAAASGDDTLPVLTCVRMAGEGGELEMSATDRYRLAVDRLHWTGPDDVAALVPAVILAKMAKAADKSGKISMHLAEGFAGFSDGTRSLIVRTNPGEFPRFKSLIPSGPGTIVTVDAAKLEAAIVRAGKIAERRMPVGFDLSETGVTVTATVDGATASTQTVAATIDGETPQEWRFCPAYLSSMLAGFAGDVQIALRAKVTTTTTWDGREVTSTSQQPPVLTADGDTFTAVVMPIRKQQ